ncbi:MAG: hypothetical protein ABFD50_07860 [Smithella sp.]
MLRSDADVHKLIDEGVKRLKKEHDDYAALEHRIEKAKQILAMGHTQRERDAYAALVGQEGK